MSVAEDYAALLADLGDSRRAATLMGAADAHHEEIGRSRLAQQDAEIADAIDRARAALGAAAWAEAYERGRATPIRDVLQRAYDETPEPG
jgi:hypothetical protein